MDYLLILVYEGFRIDVLGPWPEELIDDHIKTIVESRPEEPEAVFRLTLGDNGHHKSVIEWKGVKS